MAEPAWVLGWITGTQKEFWGMCTEERPYSPSPSSHVATAVSSALGLPPEM